MDALLLLSGFRSFEVIMTWLLTSRLDDFNACRYAMGPPACHPDGLGHFIGYSVRASGWRYTRWVNVTVDGVPFWHQVIGEEMCV